MVSPIRADRRRRGDAADRGVMPRRISPDVGVAKRVAADAVMGDAAVTREMARDERSAAQRSCPRQEPCGPKCIIDPPPKPCGAKCMAPPPPNPCGLTKLAEAEWADSPTLAMTAAVAAAASFLNMAALLADGEREAEGATKTANRRTRLGGRRRRALSTVHPTRHHRLRAPPPQLHVLFTPVRSSSELPRP